MTDEERNELIETLLSIAAYEGQTPVREAAKEIKWLAKELYFEKYKFEEYKNARVNEIERLAKALYFEKYKNTRAIELLVEEW